MHHRQILDIALRELPAARAAYLSRVADALGQHAAMDERAHLTYPVLAAAAAGIEPVLEPAHCAQHIIGFMLTNAEGVAHTLYSPEYLQQGLMAMTPWADRLRAALAVAIMDELASGRLVLNETKVWRFGADGRGGGGFPYAEEEEQA
jgi:hypothetical protein